MTQQLPPGHFPEEITPHLCAAFTAALSVTPPRGHRPRRPAAGKRGDRLWCTRAEGHHLATQRTQLRTAALWVTLTGQTALVSKGRIHAVPSKCPSRKDKMTTWRAGSWLPGVEEVGAGGTRSWLQQVTRGALRESASRARSSLGFAPCCCCGN